MGRQSVKRLMRRKMEGECMVTVMRVGEGYGGLMAKVEWLRYIPIFLRWEIMGRTDARLLDCIAYTEVYINRIFISVVKSVAPVSHLLSVPSASHP